MSAYWRTVCVIVIGLLLGAMSCIKKTETNVAPNDALSSEGEGRNTKQSVEATIVDDPTTVSVPGDSDNNRADMSSTRVSAKTNYPCFFTDTYEVGLVTLNETEPILDDVDYSNRVVDTVSLSPSGPPRSIQNDLIRVFGEPLKSDYMHWYLEMSDGVRGCIIDFSEEYITLGSVHWDESFNIPEHIGIENGKNSKGFFIDGYYFRWGLDFKTALSQLDDVSARRSVQYELKTEGDFIIFIVNSRCGLGLYFTSYPEKIKDYLNSANFYSRKNQNVRHLEPTERKR